MRAALLLLPGPPFDLIAPHPGIELTDADVVSLHHLVDLPLLLDGLLLPETLVLFVVLDLFLHAASLNIFRRMSMMFSFVTAFRSLSSQIASSIVPLLR